MAYTQTSSLDLLKTGFEKVAYFALRPELFYLPMCSVESTNATNRGATVTFTTFADLAAITSNLGETADVTPVAMSDTTVSVTIQEYGNAVQTTAKLQATAFMEVNPVVANVVGFNAGLSVDSIARNGVQAGTNALFAGGVADRTHIATSSTLDGKLIAKAVAKLRGANVQTFNGLYKGIIHPDVSYDLRQTTGAMNWSDPHVYTDPTGIYNGVVATLNGVQFMEASRAPLFADASNAGGSTGTIDVYGTLIVGREGWACGYSNGGGYTGGRMPTYVDIPVIDILRRFQGIGWKWFGGVAEFRSAANYRLESASSIGANT